MNLSVLLSKVLLQYTRDWERGDAAPRQPASLLFWSNFLRPVATPTQVTDVHRLARVSRRAVRPTLQLQRLFVIEPGSGRGQQEVRLTEAGRTARDIGFARFQVVDSSWRDRFGEDTVDRARRTLQTFVASLPLELPHYPMGYGPADDRITGGNAIAGKVGPPPVPAHGRDWPVVLRGTGDTVADLSLAALCSQALVAFSIEYETKSEAWRTGNSMSTVAMLGSVSPDGVPVELIPRTRAWTGGLEHDGLLNVEADRTIPGTRRARLTAAGERLQAENLARLDQVELGWRDRYGAERVDRLRSSLADIVNGLDDGLPDHLLVVFAPGTGFTVAPSVITT